MVVQGWCLNVYRTDARAGGVRGLVVLVVLLLAGCSGLQPPDPDGLPSGPAMVEHEVAIDEFVKVTARQTCLSPPAPQFCFTGAAPHTLVPRADNASVLALDVLMGPELYLDSESPAPDEVHWEIRCHGDRRCSRPLAEGDDVLPKAVRLAGLDLAIGTAIEIQIYGPVRPTASDFALDVFRTSHVTGTAIQALVPGVVVPERLVPIALDGSTGDCVLFVEADCAGFPGGSRFEFTDEGEVRGVNLTMTWSSTNAFDEDLQVRVSAAQCNATCPPSILVTGPSPLIVHADELRFDGATISVDNPNVETAVTTLGPIVGTRTPVHLEGNLTVRDDPPR